MIQGRLKADGVAVAALSVDFVQRKMTARIALISTENGQTYGAAEHSMWSSRTSAQLAELLRSVEADLREAYFDGAGLQPIERTPTSVFSPAEPEGLGELYVDKTNR